MIFGSRYIGASDTVERIYLWGARSLLVEHGGNVGGLFFGIGKIVSRFFESGWLCAWRVCYNVRRGVYGKDDGCLSRVGVSSGGSLFNGVTGSVGLNYGDLPRGMAFSR